MPIIRDKQTKKLYVYNVDSGELREIKIFEPLDVVPASLVRGRAGLLTAKRN